MNSQPSDQRLDYWRNVARSAERDLERLRDAVIEAVDAAETDSTSPDFAAVILDTLIGELRGIAARPADPHQRAQAAYNAVNKPTPGDAS